MSRDKQMHSLFLSGIKPMQDKNALSTRAIMERMDIQYKQSRLKVESLPFMIYDTTAGSEIELQSAVAGSKHNVDLPTYIEQSNYFENVNKRAKAGDTQKKVITGLEKYLNNHQDKIWENSWVWFPRKTMSSFAECTFQRDLYTDKDDPLKGQRSDFHQFIYCKDGEDFIRIPVSYLETDVKVRRKSPKHRFCNGMPA